MRWFVFPVLLLLPILTVAAQPYDIIIRDGQVYDGSGTTPVKVDVGIRGDTIAALGALDARRARTVTDARERAVAPGFINVLSWAATAAIVYPPRGDSYVLVILTEGIEDSAESRRLGAEIARTVHEALRP